MNTLVQSWTKVTSFQNNFSERLKFFMQLPDGDLSIITAGGQESGLLWVPGDTVNILTMSFGYLSNQRKHRLVRITDGVLLKYPHRIITTGSSEGTSQSTPKTWGTQWRKLTFWIFLKGILIKNRRFLPVNVVHCPSMIPRQRANAFPRQIWSGTKKKRHGNH